MKSGLSFYDNLQLAFDFALIGEIPRSLLGITVDWKDPELSVIFLFDKTPTEDETEDLDIVLTEVIANFYFINKLDSSFIEKKPNESASQYKLRHWIFLRKE